MWKSVIFEFFVAVSGFVGSCGACRATCRLFGVEETMFGLSQCDVYREDCGNLEDILLSLHNSVREGVASGREGWPTASNMRRLTWDADLEILARHKLARYLSTSCVLSPAECFWADGNFVENYDMAGRAGHPPDAGAVAAPWMFLNATEPFDDVVQRKFFRVVRADATRIGCGDAVFAEKGLSARFVLCLYDFENDDGDGRGVELDIGDVYKIGQPCSDCPPGTACNMSATYHSLCADVEQSADVDQVTDLIPDGAVNNSATRGLIIVCLVLYIVNYKMER